MTAALRFDPIRLPPECEKLRREVRAFLADEIAAGTFDPHKPNREDTDAPEFSRRVGARGWLGMTWPKKYGGHERSFLERYVVTEEMRVANAPTRRFFVADRQSGPVLLKYAPEHIKMDILPRICRGEVCFSIGMSEPNSGSDLFAAKTKASKTDGGWLINGTKIWTSSAHIADYMIAIFRTSPPTKENRRHGLTQFLVKMKQPGIQVNPIGQITGQYEFNEVVFIRAFLRGAQGFDDKLPIHYPRTTKVPNPEGESFKWFVANAKPTRRSWRNGLLRSTGSARRTRARRPPRSGRGLRVSSTMFSRTV